MKSICIKMTNSNVIEYLLEKLSSSELENVYFSCKKFKIYTNIIVHFKGKNEKSFIKNISQILADLVLELYEQKLIKMLIKNEYFYFDHFEQCKIAENTYDDLYDLEETIHTPELRFKILTNCFYEYLNFVGFTTYYFFYFVFNNNVQFKGETICQCFVFNVNKPPKVKAARFAEYAGKKKIPLIYKMML